MGNAIQQHGFATSRIGKMNCCSMFTRGSNALNRKVIPFERGYSMKKVMVLLALGTTALFAAQSQARVMWTCKVNGAKITEQRVFPSIIAFDKMVAKGKATCYAPLYKNVSYPVKLTAREIGLRLGIAVPVDSADIQINVFKAGLAKAGSLVGTYELNAGVSGWLFGTRTRLSASAGADLITDASGNLKVQISSLAGFGVDATIQKLKITSY